MDYVACTNCHSLMNSAQFSSCPMCQSPVEKVVDNIYRPLLGQHNLINELPQNPAHRSTPINADDDTLDIPYIPAHESDPCLQSNTNATTKKSLFSIPVLVAAPAPAAGLPATPAPVVPASTHSLPSLPATRSNSKYPVLPRAQITNKNEDLEKNAELAAGRCPNHPEECAVHTCQNCQSPMCTSCLHVVNQSTCRELEVLYLCNKCQFNRRSKLQAAAAVAFLAMILLVYCVFSFAY